MAVVVGVGHPWMAPGSSTHDGKYCMAIVIETSFMKCQEDLQAWTNTCLHKHTGLLDPDVVHAGRVQLVHATQDSMQY